MTVVFLTLIVVAVALSITPIAAAPRTEFAVIPDVKDDWLSAGVAFDLEKRLGRLPTLEAADRMTVATAMQNAASGDASSRVRAVIEKTGARLVLCISALSTGDGLTLRLDLWAINRPGAPLALSSKRSAAYRRAFERKGAREDLFKLVDRLVDDILPELDKAGIDVGKPESVPGLKWWPCRSVAAYEDLISGMVLLQKGDVSHAKPRLLKTLSAEPDNWFARYFLGAVMLYQGDIAKAAGYCREAISLNPEVYAGVYANLSYCYAAMGDDKQADWAKAQFERRAGKPLPARTVPGGMPMFGTRP